MTEGTMLLSGVDLDIRFGRPLKIENFLDPEWLVEDMRRNGIQGYSLPDEMRGKMRTAAYTIMQQYMHDIYSLTTVNHEHLYASFLKRYPFNRIQEDDFKRRVFYAASLISDRDPGGGGFYLHQSLQGSQIHLLTDDRFKKYDNFLRLAEEKGVVKRAGDCLIRDRSRLSLPLSFHKGRIENPVEIMVNEVEPLSELQKLLKSLVWQPAVFFKVMLVRYLLRKEQKKYEKACKLHLPPVDKSSSCLGKPYLLPAFRRRKGVVLVHSYLAVPEEVRLLANYLRRKGCWVYAPRLPGHGTSAEDLAGRKYEEWMAAVETGFTLMSAVCDRVVVGGVAVGGSLALNLAARVARVAGVFAVCPPFSLKNYSVNFMPPIDVWNRMLSKMKGEGEKHFMEFAHGNPHVNYTKNPVAGVHQIGEFLDFTEKEYAKITQPALIIQADKNPVIHPAGSKKIYEKLESDQKEYCLLSFDRNVLVNGNQSHRVHRKIASFIGEMI